MAADNQLGTNPANTLRNNDVVITSRRRHFDVITSKWRRFDVVTTLLLRHVFRGNLPTLEPLTADCGHDAMIIFTQHTYIALHPLKNSVRGARHPDWSNINIYWGYTYLYHLNYLQMHEINYIRGLKQKLLTCIFLRSLCQCIVVQNTRMKTCLHSP